MNFLSILETTDASIEAFLELSRKVKENGSQYSQMLAGNTLVMLFEKSSTRTRVSFDVAMNQLGGHVIDLDFAQIQASRGETISDTARTLGAYVDCIVARLFEQKDMVELEKYSKKPVINGQTNEEHPCQALADLFTMKECGKLEKGRVFCYLGDATKNICNSLIVACAKCGMEVRVATSSKYRPAQKFLDEASKYSKVSVLEDASEALRGADVVYTDNWTDGITAAESSSKISELKKFSVTEEAIKSAAEDCIIMHPLPANRGVEITSECLDCSKSVIWEQAKNRLHVQKAILLKMLEKVD